MNTINHTSSRPFSIEKAIGRGKKVSVLFLFLFISAFSYAVVVNPTFDSGQTEEYLNLTGGANLSRYMTIPPYVYVKNITLTLETLDLKTLLWYRFDHNTTHSNNLSVLDSQGSNTGTMQGYVFNHAKIERNNINCTQGVANVSTSCGGLSTGEYSQTTTNILGLQNGSDANYLTYLDFNAAVGFFRINYTRPQQATNTTLALSSMIRK